MDLMAATGFTDYRFGIEWSRVEPADATSPAPRWTIATAWSRAPSSGGCAPFLTMHHFTLPQWFSRTGGWRRADAAQRFGRYVEAIAPVLDAGATHVGTINEPNIVAMFAARTRQGMSALRHGLPLPDPRITDTLIDGHHATRAQLKSAHPTLAVGWGVSVQDRQPEPGAEHQLSRYTQPCDEVFLHAAAGDDWIAVQTYTRIRIGTGAEGNLSKSLTSAASKLTVTVGSVLPL